jgi:pimeloyl-ACP methyl ester carboxylesterase
MRIAFGWVLITWLSAACASAPPTAPQRIEETSYVQVGGIDQLITIRGDDTRKPVLLVVHGGPGDAQSFFVESYAPYEKDFVLVQWDQRGAGRTFEKLGASTPNLTLEQQVADGVDLAEQLHKRFPRNDLVVLGHSWGSVIATGMVQKRPDLFDAYVGTGQVATWAAGVQWQFDFLKERARASNDTAALASLEAIGKPDPLNIVQYFTFSRPLRSQMNDSDKAWFANMKAIAARSGATDADIDTAGKGMDFSGGKLIQSMVREDLVATASRFSTRYCVIQGEHDLSTPTAPAKVYFDIVAAPKKRFAVIEGAGHFALATHQAQFIAEMKACLAG